MEITVPAGEFLPYLLSILRGRLVKPEEPHKVVLDDRNVLLWVSTDTKKEEIEMKYTALFLGVEFRRLWTRYLVSFFL